MRIALAKIFYKDIVPYIIGAEKNLKSFFSYSDNYLVMSGFLTYQLYLVTSGRRQYYSLYCAVSGNVRAKVRHPTMVWNDRGDVIERSEYDIQKIKIECEKLGEVGVNTTTK